MINIDLLLKNNMIYYCLQRLKHAILFRNRRGYGVHSPFVFEFVSEIVSEKLPYYCFDTIEKNISISNTNRKLYRLLFRIVERLSFRNILILGAESSLPRQYISAVSNQINFLSPTYDGKVDMTYIGTLVDNSVLEQWDRLYSNTLCLVIRDIHKKGVGRELWYKLKKSSSVALDMMWYGILFFSPQLQHGHYTLKI